MLRTHRAVFHIVERVNKALAVLLKQRPNAGSRLVEVVLAAFVTRVVEERSEEVRVGVLQQFEEEGLGELEGVGSGAPQLVDGVEKLEEDGRAFVGVGCASVQAAPITKLVTKLNPFALDEDGKALKKSSADTPGSQLSSRS